MEATSHREPIHRSSLSRAVQGDPVPLRTGSLASLIVANLVPAVGVFVLGWQPAIVPLLYYLETLVIGAFCILKLPFSLGWFAALAVPFFVVHFGVFSFGAGAATWIAYVAAESFARDIEHAHDAFETIPWGQVIAFLIAVTISHGVSFTQNFLGRREFETHTDVNQLMIAPYRRTIAMFAVGVIGTVVVVLTRLPSYLILPFIVAKTIVDLFAHRAERRRAMPRTI